MKNDVSPIEDVELNWPKKNPRYPVWNGPSKSDKKARFLDKPDHGTSMQDDVSPIEDVELNWTKKNSRYPVWNGPQAVKKNTTLLDKESYQAPAKKNITGNLLGITSKKRQIRQQDSHAKGPEGALVKESDCGALLNTCRQAAEKAVATEGETDRNVVEVLTGISKLKRLVSTNPAAGRELNRAYKAAGIRITGRTANPFTPMVKLVFPKKAQKPATVSRNASVLRLAEEENIEPSSLAGFVRQNGGLAACASRAAERAMPESG